MLPQRSRPRLTNAAKAGALAGRHAARDPVGIVIRGGEFTRARRIFRDGNPTARLDRRGLQSGAVLSLPKA